MEVVPVEAEVREVVVCGEADVSEEVVCVEADGSADAAVESERAGVWEPDEAGLSAKGCVSAAPAIPASRYASTSRHPHTAIHRLMIRPSPFPRPSPESFCRVPVYHAVFMK